jgi:anti-sigma regulatory factor (Ser/Thr protein kinase)
MQSQAGPGSASTSDAATSGGKRNGAGAALTAARATIDGLQLEVGALRAENERLAKLLGAADSGSLETGGGRLGPFELTVPVGPHAPAAARAGVTEWLDGHITESARDNARLLVSELVTNCVQHGHLAADAPVRIRAYLADGVLRVEVRNPGRDGSVRRRKPVPTGGGYGLHLLELLAASWGVNTGGTQVWFELPASTA